MPETPLLQQTFGQPTERRPGCGFPVARLLGLFHAGTGLLMKLVVAPLCTHDLTHVQQVHPSLECGDVLVAYVPTPLSPSSSRLACTPCGASAPDRSWISRPGGPWSGRVCGGRRPSNAFHALVGSPRSASMTHSWPG